MKAYCCKLEYQNLGNNLYHDFIKVYKEYCFWYTSTYKGVLRVYLIINFLREMVLLVYIRETHFIRDVAFSGRGDNVYKLISL